jgi:hypothetical protein
LGIKLESRQEVRKMELKDEKNVSSSIGTYGATYNN